MSLTRHLIVPVAVTVLCRSAVGDVVFIPDDYLTLTAAIEAANADPGHWTINIRPGTWNIEVGTLAISDAATLVSTNGPSVTTIASPGNATLNVTRSADSAVLTGLTVEVRLEFDMDESSDSRIIENCILGTLALSGPGSVTVTDSDFSDGGIAVTSIVGAVTVTGCTFTGGVASVSGGAITVVEGSDFVLVIDCIFQGNSAEKGGAIYGPAVIIDCTFIGNTATQQGGAVFQSDHPIIGCAFVGNVAPEGGAIYNSGQDIGLCSFTGNEADFGGAVYVPADVLIHDSLFLENDAIFGGAIYNAPGLSFPQIVNDTFVDNHATIGEAILNDAYNILTVRNSIFWGNFGPSNFIIDDDLAFTSLTWTLHQPSWTSNRTNVTTDPLFVGGGDYRLQAGSPGIDAGHNWAIAAIAETDLDGNPRFVADPADFDPGCGIPAVVDMGAYEFQIGAPFPVKLGDIDGDGTVGITDFLALLGDWGPCIQTCCLADLDLDENVGITDFLILLGNWG